MQASDSYFNQIYHHAYHNPSIVRLFGRAIRVNRSNRDTRSADLGANLFIGNLDHDADEALLQTTFAVFGPLLGPPKIMREPDTGRSRGFGFISYDSFEAADTAIANMNGQYICNRPITVSFALKKDGKGERHGTETERMLAAQSRNNRTGGVASASGSIVPQPVLMPKIANPAFAALQMPTMMAPAGLAGPFVMPGAGVVPMPQFHPQ
jgi:splicing factor 3B subunit 4